MTKLNGKFVIDLVSDGKTVGEYIRKTLGYSANNLKALKYKGKITVDGKNVRADYVLHIGNVLETEFAETASDAIEPENIPLEILYEDDDIVAINKPCGMPVHPSFKHRYGTLANALMYYYRDKPFTVRVLTRLDGDTTGVVLVAKNAVAASKFEHTKAQKRYYAVCVGVYKNSCGQICAPIARDNGVIKRKVCENGKYALTKYRVLSDNGKLSLVEAFPVTGRTHQIRVHMAYIGNPIYADYLYGKEIEGETLYLHCKEVQFIHPVTNKAVKVEADIPPRFRRV